jgi:hypothetical protein
MTQEQHSHNRQIATVFGLGGIAVVHLLDLPGKFKETPYMGFMYVGVILAAAYLIERLLTRKKAIDYAATAAVSLAVLVGFVINRTIGMPGATDDIGNWLEPLGFLSLFVETWTLWQAMQAYLAAKKLA